MTTRKPFIHLHGHSVYSVRDAYNSFEDILRKASNNNQPAIAVTDHYNMYNISEFYFKSIDKDKKTGERIVEGVTPIIGCELGVAPEGTTYEALDEAYFHLTAIAISEKGKQNLMHLASISTKRDDEHFYRNPRVTFADLEKFNDGIVILSGCLGSEVNNLLTAKQYKIAKQVMQRYSDVFGDRYYVEIQDHGIKQQEKNNKYLIEYARELGIELVLTNDYHYCERENAHYHGSLVYGSQGKEYKGCYHSDTEYYHEDEYYIKDDDEMWEIAQKWDIEDAYHNTYKIFERIDNVIFDCDEVKFPAAQLEKYDTADEELRHLAYELITKKYPNPDERVIVSSYTGDKSDISKVPEKFLSPETPNERLERELLDIAEAGYSDYFLIVYDILDYCHKNDILLGDGRGSAGGSILSNVLDITNLCPLKYGLFFERFFNKGRVDSPPDIDIDFPPTRRDEVISYIVGKYGEDYVAQIATFSKLAKRSALNTASKAVTGEMQAGRELGYLLDKKNDDIQWNMENNKSFAKAVKKDKTLAKVVDTAIGIEGCVNSRSTHAAGMIISKKPLNEYIPTLNNNSASGWTTQIEYPLLERQRLLKVDLLGLETLDVIQNTVWHIEETRGITVDPKNIPDDDKKTFDLFNAGDTKGVFQLEADWCNDLIKKTNVSHFDHISALVALIRPGSMNSGMTDTYMKCAQGLQEPKAIHPNVAYATEETYHCLLYQEQLMETAKALAGYDLLEADALRKAVSKSKKEQLMLMRDEFVEGCKNHSGISAKDANEVFDAIEKFGDYGFNKAHSVGYAKNSYGTAYFKANYFIEFMSSILTSVIGDFDKTKIYIDNVLEHGYEMLPPDINISTDEFMPDIENNGIRFPLGAIDSVGPSAVNAIMEERDLNGDYKSVEDFLYRTPGKAVKKDTIIALTVVGAFDNLGYTRKSLYEDIEDIIADVRGKAKKAKAKGLGMKLGDEELTIVEKTSEEYDLKEMADDEETYMGFRFSITSEDKKKRLKEIRRKSKVNYDFEGSTSEVDDSEPTKKKSSALERLKNRKHKEVDPEITEAEKQEVNSIKDALKSKMKSNKANIKPIRKSDGDTLVKTETQVEDDDSLILACLDKSQVLEMTKILRMAKKYKDEDGVPLVFKVTTSDESEYILETKTTVGNPKRFTKILCKIVGDDNAKITERYWD